MKKAIILTLGYDCFAIPATAGMAGKLIELLAECVPCRRDFSARVHEDNIYRIQPRRTNVSVQLVAADQILPPDKEDLEGKDVVELTTLPGAMKLLKGGRS